MPASRKQQRAAAAELRKRRQGGKQQPAGRSNRPFGAARTETLRRVASNPDPTTQKQAAQQEQIRRRTGGQRKPDDHAGFRSATDERVNFYATASPEAIQRRNDRERR